MESFKGGENLLSNLQRNRTLLSHWLLEIKIGERFGDRGHGLPLGWRLDDLGVDKELLHFPEETVKLVVNEGFAAAALSHVHGITVLIFPGGINGGGVFEVEGAGEIHSGAIA